MSKGPTLPSLHRLYQLAKRCQEILPQYQPVGPLIFDQANHRWINPLDDLEAHGLALTLLRLQRGTKLQASNTPRQVIYVREGDGDYLETPSDRYTLETSGVGVLEVVLEILEGEQ